MTIGGDQWGVKYTLEHADGTVAVFNDPADPNYVGMARWSGLDDAEVREVADDRTEADGGVHGNFWRGRRPVVGTIEIAADSTVDRNTKYDRLWRASHALRSDSILTWTPDGSAEQFLRLRKNGPLRRGEDTGWLVKYSLPMVAAEPRKFSAALHTANWSALSGGWTARTAAEANTWRCVAYGNGLFVAGAGTGTNRVMTSPDGITWTARTPPEANSVSGIAYGNGLFAAVTVNGTNRVMTSPDGITWTARTAAEANAWGSVTYGNGLFVAVAADGTNRVMTSPDGITWTARTAAATDAWGSVTYGNGLFVATAYGGGTNRVMTSPDGITWTARTAAEANAWGSVTYGNGLFVAVAYGGTNRVMTSPDGITWTARTAAEANTWRCVAYGNGLFVAVAADGTNRVMTSPDGITWTARTAAEANSWQSVAYGGGLFAAVAGSGTSRVMTSPDPTSPSPLVNAGSAHTPPLVRINGTATDPVLTNLTTGETLALDYTVTSPNYIEIDFAARTVLLNGTTNIYSAITGSPEWWELAPGNNLLALTQAGSTGLTNPSSAASMPDISADWASPTNVLSSNNSYASTAVTLSGSDYLRATGFGFTVPGNATIVGVTAAVERKCTAGAVVDANVRLVSASGVGLNPGKSLVGVVWPASDAVQLYGGPTDTWGQSLTPAIVNDSDFGFELSVTGSDSGTAAVDHMQLQVHYIVPLADCQIDWRDAWG